jgi:hypothetical protein
MKRNVGQPPADEDKKLKSDIVAGRRSLAVSLKELKREHDTTKNSSGQMSEYRKQVDRGLENLSSGVSEKDYFLKMLDGSPAKEIGVTQERLRQDGAIIVTNETFNSKDQFKKDDDKFFHTLDYLYTSGSSFDVSRQVGIKDEMPDYIKLRATTFDKVAEVLMNQKTKNRSRRDAHNFRKFKGREQTEALHLDGLSITTELFSPTVFTEKTAVPESTLCVSTQEATPENRAVFFDPDAVQNFSNLENRTRSFPVSQSDELAICLGRNPHKWSFLDKQSSVDDSFLTDNHKINGLIHCSPKTTNEDGRYVMVSRASYKIEYMKETEIPEYNPKSEKRTAAKRESHPDNKWAEKIAEEKNSWRVRESPF